jgi:hypothetical protein
MVDKAQKVLDFAKKSILNTSLMHSWRRAKRFRLSYEAFSKWLILKRKNFDFLPGFR